MSAAEVARAAAAPPSGLPRLLAGIHAEGAVSLSEHLARHGALPLSRRGRSELVDAVAAAGLRGRGGAAFPTAQKLAAVRAARGRAFVVANGVEGEPVSGKDKVLLAYAPHLVLDGAVVAAHAVGAKEAVVAVGRAAHPAVVRAIAERRKARLDGGIALSAVRVPERFVAGEETALVRFLDGGPALPTSKRPYERGVGGSPTLVQNVETLAHLALIARFGPGWFRAVGTADEPGSALVTLSGAVRRPGVYEIPLGIPMHELLAQAGGLVEDVQAYLVGGYFGTWIAAGEAEGLRFADADLARVGASLGARGVVALPASACGVAETARVARYLAGESAGQCGPCVHGLAAVAANLEQLGRRSPDGAHEALLRRRLRQIAGRGACAHPDGAARFVASALRVFAAEFERHLTRRRCSGTAAAQLPVPRSRPEAVR
ncbi:MAG: NADH-ubiquinone oxidoreductase-F iron-sulfur binding region domain-containing protein [Gaiellaceae bacterium]